MAIPTEVVTVGVAAIAAGGAWAAQRSAAKASMVNTSVTSRLEAEKEAYERARTFDIQTIERQQQEIKDLREQVVLMRERLAKLEGRTPMSMSNLEGLLGERLKDNSGDQEQ
jgi:TolA-binding protein